MRFPTFPECLFGFSIAILIAFISAFNLALLSGEPICELDLLNEAEANCIIEDNSATDFRIVVRTGGNRETATLKIPISVTINSNTENLKFENILPGTASTGGGRRYYSNFNYGLFKLPQSSNITINISANKNVNKFSLFKAKILENPDNYVLYFLGSSFLVILFFSIYFRQKVFVKGIGKPLPYVLYFFVVLLILT